MRFVWFLWFTHCVLEGTTMMFSVPQFIDVEDKIIGPLTLKQFIYLAGGAGLSKSRRGGVGMLRSIDSRRLHMAPPERGPAAAGA